MTEAEPPSTIPAQFAATVAARAGRDAVATIAETITYAELDRRSGALARALLASVCTVMANKYTVSAKSWAA